MVWSWLDLVVLTLTHKILSRLYLRNRKVYKIDSLQAIDWGCRCAAWLCDIYLTFDLAVVTLIIKYCWGLSGKPEGVGPWYLAGFLLRGVNVLHCGVTLIWPLTLPRWSWPLKSCPGHITNWKVPEVDTLQLHCLKVQVYSIMVWSLICHNAFYCHIWDIFLLSQSFMDCCN